MATDIEYALMAGASYFDTRTDVNRFPTPLNWLSFNHQARDSGFEAISFVNGTEIVISFAGTYPKNLNGDLFPLVPVDLQADIGLATGFGSAQLLQAAEYYLQVKAANPNANITFTGHSLGGGLAALMGVFFDQTTVTFDQAPFLASAKQSIAMDVLAYLTSKFPVATYPLISSWLSPLTRFIAPVDLLVDSLPGRTAKVTGINTQGEFLSVAPLTLFDKIGAQTSLDHGPTNISGTDLHAQALLAAFLQSNQSAAAGGNPLQTLSEVTKKLTDLLGMIFDPNLYLFDTDKRDENFLDRLVRHEAGNAPLPNGGTVAADAMVTRFTADLWKIAQDGGLSINESNGTGTVFNNLNNVAKALTAFAMQKYYEETTGSPGYKKEFFTDLAAAGAGSGGIRFDLADVSTKVKVALEAGKVANLSDAKGYALYFSQYLVQENSGLTAEERQLISSLLPYMRDWYIQAGFAGLNATDTLNRGAFMLGGNGADSVHGGAVNDDNYDLERRAA